MLLNIDFFMYNLEIHFTVESTDPLLCRDAKTRTSSAESGPLLVEGKSPTVMEHRPTFNIESQVGFDRKMEVSKILIIKYY